MGINFPKAQRTHLLLAVLIGAWEPHWAQQWHNPGALLSCMTTQELHLGLSPAAKTLSPTGPGEKGGKGLSTMSIAGPHLSLSIPLSLFYWSLPVA